MLRDLVARSRSYRRFVEERPVGRETLLDLVGTARLMPSAGNRQPLKYILSCEPGKNSLIFDCLKFAAYLTDWQGPEKGERPSAYILILGDSEIAGTIPWDHSIAAQTIMLAAAEQGLGGCIIASIDRERLTRSLKIPPRYRVLLALAIGYPAETVVIEEMKGGDHKYWRDADGVHHVPKRPLGELILEV